MGRESMVLRGQVFELDKRGAPRARRHAGIRHRARLHPEWRRRRALLDQSAARPAGRAGDAGSAPYASTAEYAAFGGPFDLNADLVEALLAAPDRSLALLPGGRARAELLVTATVGDGDRRKTVTAYAVTGLSNTPLPIWVDDKGHFFAFVSALSWLPAGYESAETLLQKTQDEALARHSPAVLKALLKTPAGPVAFVHVRAFLGGTHFAEDQTIVVRDGVITRVLVRWPRKIPKGTQVIDGAGKTWYPDCGTRTCNFPTMPPGQCCCRSASPPAAPGQHQCPHLARAERRAHGLLLTPRLYPPC